VAAGVVAVAVALLELVSVELVSANELPALVEVSVELASVEVVSDTVAVFELSVDVAVSLDDVAVELALWVAPNAMPPIIRTAAPPLTTVATLRARLAGWRRFRRGGRAGGSAAAGSGCGAGLVSMTSMVGADPWSFLSAA
jgi:hypothetical protein